MRACSTRKPLSGLVITIVLALSAMPGAARAEGDVERFIGLIDEMTAIAERNQACDTMESLLTGFVRDGRMRILRLSAKSERAMEKLEGEALDKAQKRLSAAIDRFKLSTEDCPQAAQTLEAMLSVGEGESHAAPTTAATVESSIEGTRAYASMLVELAVIAEGASGDCAAISAAMDPFVEEHLEQARAEAARIDKTADLPGAEGQAIETALQRLDTATAKCDAAEQLVMELLQPLFRR